MVAAPVTPAIAETSLTPATAGMPEMHDRQQHQES